MTSTVASGAWKFISISTAYIDSNLGLTKVYYYAYINSVMDYNTFTSFSIIYNESDNDIIYIGD